MGIWDAIGDAVGAAANAATDAVEDAVEAAGAAAGDAATAVADGVEELVDGARAVGQAAMEGAKDILEVEAALIDMVVEAPGRLLSDPGDFEFRPDGLFRSIGTAAREATYAVADVARDGLDALGLDGGEIVSDVAQGLSDVANAAMEGAKGALQVGGDLPGRIAGTAADVAEDTFEAMTGMTAAAGAAVAGAVDAAADGLEATADVLGDIVGELSTAHITVEGTTIEIGFEHAGITAGVVTETVDGRQESSVHVGGYVIADEQDDASPTPDYEQESSDFDEAVAEAESVEEWSDSVWGDTGG